MALLYIDAAPAAAKAQFTQQISLKHLCQTCKKPKLCLQGVWSLGGRHIVTGDYHSSYLLWIAESSDHGQPQVSRFFYQMSI